jgi:hypothetical protein
MSIKFFFMQDFHVRVPIVPLHVEIDGRNAYRQAHRALVTSIEAMQLYLDASSAGAAFVDAAHASGMHILPDDVEEIRKAS